MHTAQQIGWDPISVNYHLALSFKLLLVYLIVVAAISVVKSAWVLRLLWFLSSSSRNGAGSDGQFLSAWEACSIKIKSLKRLVIITLLLSALVAVLLLKATFVTVAEQKVFGIGALGGGVVEALSALSLGLAVSSALYIFCSFFEGSLLRRRSSWRSGRRGAR